MNHRFGQQDAIIKHLPASVSMRTELGGDTKRILDNHFSSLITSLTALQEACQKEERGRRRSLLGGFDPSSLVFAVNLTAIISAATC